MAIRPVATTNQLATSTLGQVLGQSKRNTCSITFWHSTRLRTLLLQARSATFLNTASISAFYCFTLYQLRNFPTRAHFLNSLVSVVFLFLQFHYLFFFIPIDFVVFYYVYQK